MARVSTRSGPRRPTRRERSGSGVPVGDPVRDAIGGRLALGPADPGDVRHRPYARAMPGVTGTSTRRGPSAASASVSAERSSSSPVTRFDGTP